MLRSKVQPLRREEKACIIMRKRVDRHKEGMWKTCGREKVTVRRQ